MCANISLGPSLLGREMIIIGYRHRLRVKRVGSKDMIIDGYAVEHHTVVDVFYVSA